MSAAAVDSGSLVGQTVGGKFLVEAYVGGGAMGEVYRAKHVDLARTIALKVMRSTLSDATFAVRFQREAKAASLLDHPNTVRVLDFGTESSGLAYIAMEYLDGRDLYQLIKAEHPLEPARIVNLLAQALSAMKAAHRLGIIHRDIKPENIMVTESPDDEGGDLREVVKVCDFGIAKLSEIADMQTDPGRALTGTGTLMGTPEYMSPEQARGEPLDARSDLYSMGIVLFQMLTGRVPFVGESPLGVVVKQVTDLPPKPRSIRPEVDPRLEEICLRSLEKRPDDRFQSAGEMRAALLGVVDPSQSLPLISLRSSGVAPSSDSARSVGPSSEADLGTRPTVPHDVGPPQPVKARSRAGVLLLVLLGGIAAGVALLLVARLFRDAPVSTRAENPPGTIASTSTNATSPSVELPVATPTPSGQTPPKTTPTASAPANVPSVKAPASHVAASASSQRPPLPSPSAVSSASGTPSAPPAATEPPQPIMNTDQAYVRVGHVASSTGAQPAVTAYMGRATPTLSNCYRNALKAANKPKGGPLAIALSIDDQGTIISVVVVPNAITAALPDLTRCFQGTMSNAKIGKVDGTATADVQLSLVPPP